MSIEDIRKSIADEIDRQVMEQRYRELEQMFALVQIHINDRGYCACATDGKIACEDQECTYCAIVRAEVETTNPYWMGAKIMDAITSERPFPEWLENAERPLSPWLERPLAETIRDSEKQ